MTDPLGLINNSHVAGAGIPARRPSRPVEPGEQGSSSFKDVLMKNIEQVNRLQQESDMAMEDYMAGRRNDIDVVLTAAKKSEMAFKLLTQVHNKMVDAYEEIKQIHV